MIDPRDLADTLPFTVAMLHLGDLNTYSATATKRPRIDIERSRAALMVHVAKCGFKVIAPAPT